MTAHAENTPGYPVRVQYAFSIKDGVPRAWMLAVDQSARAVLVPVPFETAKAQVERDQADQVPGLIADTQSFGRQVPLSDCGSGVVAGTVDVDVVAVQKTAVIAAGRGRLVVAGAGEASVGEPLMAVCEGGEDRVACCGECADAAGTPNAILFDRYRAAEDGGYAVAESTEYAIPKSLARAYAQKAPACLPWVRIARDPERFRACLAAARAIGPIKDSRDVKKLVGDYLSRQDQEVFLVILLDVQGQVRGISEIARGSRDRVDVPVPDTLRIAVVDGATAIIVAHCHPSGATPKPSEADEALTNTLVKASKAVHLDFVDHVIFAADRYYSFSDAGKIPGAVYARSRRAGKKKKS